ncbi:hypothetical protein OG455_33470 [Kitasatospora sp. NBC_01287]|uniref:hypothetical protein n=1 Tax=Kitasatospora sp. NBC_01287 TaxID=2903573 RepID=UPI00225B56F2|nr:hypothetical protein [Kitasatospora sp. NBC_01287]MCX4750364.1 hypothetical protein [Kitasatospora sp. NBC_01287]
MNARRKPPRALYTPQLGELVRDEKHGVNGLYMGPGYGKHPTVFLRPTGGGMEWETPASEIQRLPQQPELDPVPPPGTR